MPVLPVLESGGFGAEILENSGLLITALAGLGAALIFLFPLLREEGDESSLKSRGIICMTVLAVSASLFFKSIHLLEIWNPPPVRAQKAALLWESRFLTGLALRPLMGAFLC